MALNSFGSKGILLHHEAFKISPQQKLILVCDLTTRQEKEVVYDKLLTATGARSVLLPMKGSNLKGIFTLYLLEDGIAINKYIAANSPRKGLIIGAGSIGMEMAEAFSSRGLSVTMVEKASDILGSMDTEISEVVEKELNQNGSDLN